MSHYSSVTTKIKSKKDLVKALQKISSGKWNNCVEVHDEPDNLVGYHGDKREQKAHIIIRRKDVGSASNDIGFVRQKDGTYQAVISDYDKNSLGYNQEWLDKLSQLYSVEVIKSTAETNGFDFEEEQVNQQGIIYVNCTRED